VYAKYRTSPARFSEALRNGQTKKTYLAETEGIPEMPERELRDLLFYDRKRSKVFVVDRNRNGVKEAILQYRVLKTAIHPQTNAPIALVEVHPVTGRTHQIRVQFASRRLPLLGDRKYGGHGNKGISLACHRIVIPAVGSEPERTVCYEPIGEPWDWMK
jgi:23S rRNA pseudouridine1911/1915/1917 synthase